MLPMTPLLVTGLPGSGTTIVARMLIALGWPGYERFHCEEPDVVATNRLLIDGGKFDHSLGKQILDSLDFPWIVKDPQFCLTLGYWLPVLSSYQPCLLVCRREEDSVRNSWAKAGRNVDEMPWWQASLESQVIEWPYPKIDVEYGRLSKAMALWDATGKVHQSYQA